MTKIVRAASLAIALSLTLAGPAVVTAEAHTGGIHDNCTNLNKKWPHGVGRRGAVDRTSGTPVRTFTRNTTAYRAAENHNGTLDRDNDGIACEKA